MREILMRFHLQHLLQQYELFLVNPPPRPVRISNHRHRICEWKNFNRKNNFTTLSLILLNSRLLFLNVDHNLLTMMTDD